MMKPIAAFGMALALVGCEGTEGFSEYQPVFNASAYCSTQADLIFPDPLRPTIIPSIGINPNLGAQYASAMNDWTSRLNITRQNRSRYYFNCLSLMGGHR